MGEEQQTDWMIKKEITVSMDRQRDDDAGRKEKEKHHAKKARR